MRRSPFDYEECENATTDHGVRRTRVIADQAADRENEEEKEQREKEIERG